MGQAADILGVRQAFLRSLDAAKLLTPQRSDGGHRRYSRYQLRIAARAHELVAGGTPLESACRIIILEDQLAEARRINAELQHTQQQENLSGDTPE
ncbi:MerR family DNA-binding transcriptional regulator [Rhodococcus sp. KBS0724]|uniref:MerR family transcriptional regulator n=1 Tax=Rhodococcus sp. KBS0724 TaxID=1179674 RepID=UPI00110D6E28|nr:MerR family transcriptional regulator [Rhodococcus sp. KBS0724]TSD47484.1 MerR family DNA-binding transcriptional regulator [Rhodococcus sp. KBS0724]